MLAKVHVKHPIVDGGQVVVVINIFGAKFHLVNFMLPSNLIVKQEVSSCA